MVLMRQWLPFALFICLFAGPLKADEGRYQDYVFGARAISLGGAFTAISNDASGIFYNPAGLVDVSRSNLSIATSFLWDGIEWG